MDAVLPQVPVRQWVLTVPYRLRYRLAWDHALSRAVLGVYARALLAFYAQAAHRRGVAGGRTRTVTVIQRFGGALAGIVGAAVQGRVALGPRAGARVRRVGPDADGSAVTSRGPRQAHLEGFDLHANVWVHGNDRAGLERLCRYLLRPPLAHDRLRLRADGRVVVDLKTAWHDGTTQLVFEPIELLEKLAAITPTTAAHCTW
jgi:hypothetical protein